MNLGVFLAIGESLTDLSKKGQLARLVNYNIRAYAKTFEKVYIFTYANEKNFTLPKNCQLITNTLNIHRYPYSILMPLLKIKVMQKCNVLRGLQLSGGIPAAIARIIYGKRFVINFGYNYSKFARIEGKMFQSFLYKIIEEPILALASAIIVTSSEINKELTRKVKKSKIHFIPNGVDTKLFKKINKRLKHKFTVLYIGRLERQKNLENLVRALSFIKGVRAFFYGEGSAKSSLIAQAKKIKVNLKVKGPIEYRRIPQVMSSADVFVLPSLVEGSPKILLEAMACQKAIVGSDVVGISEIIINNYNGLLTNYDPKSIVEAIKKLENKRLREKLGKNARKHIVKNYEIHSLLDKEVKLLKQATLKK